MGSRRQSFRSWFPGGTTAPEGDWYWTGLPLGDAEPHGDWLVAYRVERQDGQLVIAEMRILPWPNAEEEEQWVAASLQRPDLSGTKVDEDGNEIGPVRRAPAIPEGGLSLRALRALRTEPALDCARQNLRTLHERSFAPPSFTREVIDAPRQPGRRGRSDRFYAEIAAAYVEIWPRSRAPIQDVKRRLADQGLYYEESTVRSFIDAARRRELLTRPPRGKAGGELTDKALALLDGS